MAVSIYDASKQIPQQTVADSSTGMNKFAPYFGEATHQPNLVMDPYRKRSYDHYALPDAYQGRNYFMGTVVETKVMSEDSFYTQTLLPLRQVSDGEVAARGISWNRWEFDSHWADVLPEETPASLITSKREQRSRAFVRRGKAFNLEHGFMETPEGREAYMRKLEQMVNLVAETTNFDVIYELLNVDVGEREWTARYGYVRQESVRQAIEAEKRRWAILQKTKNGFEKMDAQIKQDMRRKNARADTWILHESMMTHLHLVPPEKTDHYLAGERGPSNVTNYDSTRPIAYLNGNISVYLSRSFAVGDYNQEMDPWLRERQIGEYFLMASEYQYNDDVSDYNTQEMSPAVYDEYSDDYAVLAITSAINNMILFDHSGHLRTPQKHYDVPNWEEDIKRDPFVKPSNPHGVNSIEVWGEMHQDYLPTEGVMRIARSAVRKMAERYQGGEKQLSTIMRDGMALLRVINSRELTQEYLTEIGKAPNNELATAVNDGRFAKSNAMNVLKRDPNTGSFVLPDTLPANATTSALIGFANYPGMLAARQRLRKGGDLEGYNVEELQTLSAFAGLLEDLAAIGRQLFPGSAFLDARFTAPQYGQMSAESVLLDNLLGGYQEALWMPKEAAGPPRTGADQGRLEKDDQELLQSLKTTAQALGHLSADGAALQNTSATIFNDRFPLPSATATGQDNPYATHEERTIVAELYRQLNVFTKAGAKVADDFLALASREGVTIQNVLDYAKNHHKVFQTDSLGAWKAAVKRLEAGLADARQADSTLGDTAYGVALYGAEGAADARVRIQAQYGTDAPPAGPPGTYYRTPLTLSASQIQQLARQPNRFSATISRPESNGAVGANQQEVQLIARQISQVSNQSGGMDVQPAISSLYLQQDLGHLGRTFVAQSVMARREQQADSMHVDGGGYGAQKRLRDELEQRAQMKRRRLAVGGSGNQLAQETVGYYAGYSSAGGVGSLGADSMQSRMVADGRDGIDDGAAGKLTEVHDRLGAHYRQVERSSDSDIVKLFGKLFLGTPTTRQSLLAMARNNVVLPIVVMAARPHMRYNMRMGIKMLAGSGTGNTFIGQSWFELSDDTQKGMHHADYRYWSKSIVLEPKNVYLAFDLYSQEGLGGAGVQPISLADYDPAANKFGRNREESLFYIPLPYSSGVQGADNRQQLPDTLDLSGRFLHFKVLGGSDNAEELMSLHYPTAARMNGHIGWRTEEAYGLVPLYDTSHPWRFDQNDTTLHYNTTVCKASQLNWDRNTKKHTIKKQHTGHWGKLSIPGCREIRNGGLKAFEDIVQG